MSGEAGLYVHVPFCARACPYCDFDFQVGRRPPVDAWLDALARERRARALPSGMPVRTVYVGGGTPSLLGPEGLRRLFAFIDEHFAARDARERTVELNPEHVDERLLDALVQAGVDRVSLGVQSLHEPALVMLGRVHRAAAVRQALRAAAARGLRVSADLIVGWPGQTSAALAADVTGLVQLGVEHVSIYALTIESGTPWESLMRRGRRSMPDPDAQAERLTEAAALLHAAGLHHYEVASHARPGARAIHNVGYWTGRDYVGLGPSAASARTRPDGSVERRTNVRGWERWQADPGGGAGVERLAPRAAAAEALWLGLRLLDGIEVGSFLERHPAVDEQWLRARVDHQCARGNLEWTSEGVLRVASGRWLWHDEIGADVLESSA